MDLILLHQLLLIMFSALGLIVAIMGLLTSKQNRPAGFKPILIFCSIIVFFYVSLGTYLEIVNKDQVYADLIISIGEPYLVNLEGTETEKFIEDSNYLVVSYNKGFSLNATIELRNTKTLEKYTYETYDIGNGYRIANMSSGEYDIKITTSEYPVYSERISLNTTNMGWDDPSDSGQNANIWDFTAFMFEDFYDNATDFDIAIGNLEKLIEYPAFGIYSDNISVSKIFSSEVDWEQGGMLAGKFYGYKDVYTVSNAIEPTLMESVIIDIME